jgi:hypothetical protein
MLRLAEISARFTEDSEAQNFAGAIFIQNNEGAKAVECVKRLLALGKTADADEIAISTIPSLSDDGRIALAQELETSDPVLSCRLYQHASDWKNFARIAGNIIDSGTLYEVRNIAWLISVTHRQNILMRDALTKLESFGEEGARMVKGIRMEMRIRHLFEVSEIGARSDALSG